MDRSKHILKVVGSSSHTTEDREINDYYATHPQAVRDFLAAFCDRDGEYIDTMIWEPAVGEGNIAEVLEEAGHHVMGTDLINRGYGTVHNFLEGPIFHFPGDIITNPPYKYSLEFVERSLASIREGQLVIMLFKVQFLASKKRWKFFQTNPIKYVYIHSSRIKIMKNNKESGNGNALDYAWFIWEKGYRGETITRWIE